MMFKKKEATRLLQLHVTCRFGQCEEDSSSTSTNDENKILAKKPRILGFIAAVSRKKNLVIQ